MGLAPFFARSALAASQVIAGFDADRFEQRLGRTGVGLAIDSANARRAEGRVLADLSIRLLARLYPTLALDIEDEILAGDLRRLALEINPDVDLVDDAEYGISIGRQARQYRSGSVHAGSNGWLAMVGTQRPYATGTSRLPFGAGAAASLAAANLFRMVLIEDGTEALDSDTTLSTFDGSNDPDMKASPPILRPRKGSVALIGLGAIGNAAAWALGTWGLPGQVGLVDHEVVDLGNLQRYVLTLLSDVGALKTEVAARAFLRGVAAQHPLTYAEFAELTAHTTSTLVVALDSARDRRQAQSSLPASIINAWTQPGDLGVAVHGRFGGLGACVECLYLRDEVAPNEDEVVAAALGVPEQVRVVRDLLAYGKPVPPEFMSVIAERKSLDPRRSEAFVGRTIRELYVDGFCGGGLIPLGAMGSAPVELHVPLAHQSALAGVLLAAAYARSQAGPTPEHTSIMRVDVMRALGVTAPQPAAARGPGCICRDADYVSRFEAKWSGSRERSWDSRIRPSGRRRVGTSLNRD